jgi:SAM-dependent methyltransferase
VRESTVEWTWEAKEPTVSQKLYHELASWWPLLSASEEHEEEATFYARLVKDSCGYGPRSLLELGSGGGNNAWHLKRSFDLTLVEPSTEMLAISRDLNPECEHLEGDMRTVRLDRQFDAVFIHDAIMYMTKREELRQAFETAYVHTKPDGAAVFASDHVRETFGASTRCGETTVRIVACDTWNGHGTRIRRMMSTPWITLISCVARTVRCGSNTIDISKGCSPGRPG